MNNDKKFHEPQSPYMTTRKGGRQTATDVNGDGQEDLITGKRFFAHQGRDPGGKEPVLMYWYEIVRSQGKPPEFTRHEIVPGFGTGVGTQFQVIDFNGDKKLDLVLSNKSGVNLLLQK